MKKTFSLLFVITFAVFTFIGNTAMALTGFENNTGRLVNISTRIEYYGPGGRDVIIGFVVVGGEKQVLARAAGPVLAQFGVANTVPAPFFIIRKSTPTGWVQINHPPNLAWNVDPWTGADISASVSAVFDRVGAFPFPAGENAASVHTVGPGSYTMEVYSNNGAWPIGILLPEVYESDISITPTTGRLVNISTRAYAGRTAEKFVIAGFVVTGTNETLIIRANGPSLASYGVANVLADPVLEIISGGKLIASNDNMGGAITLTADGQAMGITARAITQNDAALVGSGVPVSVTSKESALVLFLPHGGIFSTILRGQPLGPNAAGDQTFTVGNAQVEVYERPNVPPSG